MPIRHCQLPAGDWAGDAELPSPESAQQTPKSTPVGRVR